MTIDGLAEHVAPLLDAPERSAVLLDVDGTLAPITHHAAAAEVPPGTRALLAEVAVRFGLVACVSGRRAADARRVVGVGSLHYVGNHGSEILRRGAARAESTPAVAEWEPRVREVAHDLFVEHADAERLGVRLEDKGPIQGLHWRGSPDDDAAEAMVRTMAGEAVGRGLHAHRGRKVVELRPPVEFHKGVAVEWLLGEGSFDAALYAGDDGTDLDAFAALRRLRDAGAIASVLCVAADAEEAPAEVAEAADLIVDGPDGIRLLLQELTRR